MATDVIRLTEAFDNIHSNMGWAAQHGDAAGGERALKQVHGMYFAAAAFSASPKPASSFGSATSTSVGSGSTALPPPAVAAMRRACSFWAAAIRATLCGSCRW